MNWYETNNITGVTFNECKKISEEKYLFSFFFKYRIDHVTVIINVKTKNVEFILNDKGCAKIWSNLSEQQLKVVNAIQKDPEYAYKSFYNRVL